MPSVRLRPGKADFVRRVVNGKVEKVCLCEYNADFSVKGCIAQVHSDFLEEVVRNNGKYEDIHAVRKAGKIDQRCTYCYARRTNWGRVTPLEVTEMTRKDFETFKPSVVRIGKMSESLHPFYAPVLGDFLDLCKEYGVRIIAPTKALPSEKNLAEKLKEVNAVINYSIGNDSFEPGIVSQGFTNLWRVQQALLYRKAGVNSTLTLTCDVTSSFNENSERGFPIFQVLNASEQTGIPVRVLPLRIPSKKLAKTATGEEYSELIRGSDMFDSRRVRYLNKRNNELVPAFFHKDFRGLVKAGAGVCGQIGENEYCDDCQVFDSETRITFPTSELITVNYSSEFYRGRKNFRENIKKRRKMKNLQSQKKSTQLKLFK